MQKIIDDYLMMPSQQGNRNHSLFKAFAAAKDLGKSPYELEEIKRKALSDGLKEREIMQTLDSAFARPKSEFTPNTEGGKNLSWQDDLSTLLHNKKPNPEKYTDKIPKPAEAWTEDYKSFLGIAFKSNESVSIVRDLIHRDGKHVPGSKGDVMNVGELINKPSSDFHKWIGHDNGAYLRINPVEGAGSKDADVTSFRHVLVESDTLTLEQQIGFYKDLQLPVSGLIHSGGKSVHAWVRVEAETMEQYRERCKYVYDVLEKSGFDIDQGNKNPSRLSRLPGVKRGEQKQYLISAKGGKEDYSSWKKWYQEERSLPEVIDLFNIFDEPEPLAKEVIQGVLRKSHIMSLTGPSKSAKSWALINLGLSIAAGGTWFNHKCNQAKVLYLDMELSPASFKKRVLEVATALGVSKNKIQGNFLPIAFRGYQRKDIIQDVHKYLEKHKPDVLLLDPLYKVLQGKDENSNTEMSSFSNDLDRLAVKYGCSIVYVHHHSKGSQEGKRGLDKGSGAGVFGRHPDAILSITQKQKDSKQFVPNTYELEYDLREFKSPDSVTIRFDFPLHSFVDGGKDEMKSKIDYVLNLIKSNDVDFPQLSSQQNWTDDEECEICEALEAMGVTIENGTIKRWDGK